ncbi:glycosyltransferase family 4 protein [Shewanella sedimentimangrovi]|uniref:Glycosyltransferase family 4 protein n=1 Tax=Shewanella sedimentimangrovi TaxID=2814293 RepID=A0ABX7QYZ4_9GAMM|nr:glycosyltransferase family 4 protein [Shewanella sedimentimangrovi]QSX36028.1 glycosyltransferase family 4 protein [Shewanella sedimentimangrovi]
MTKIIFSHALVFKLTQSGRILTPGGIDNNYLRRFFDAGFDDIYLLSRSSVSDVEDVEGYRELENVNSFFLSKYTGGYKFLFSYSFYRDLYKLLKNDSLLIINYPSSTGLFLILFAYLFKLPYVVEVASDSDQYKEKRFGIVVDVVSNLLGKICIPRAVGALYVAQFLKDKWNCNNGDIVSNVHIENISSAKLFEPKDGKYVVTTVGAISYRKGIDVIVDEFEDLSFSHKIELNIIGPVIDEGLKQRIDNLKIHNVDIICHGILKRDEVISILDHTDLYIQASRSEGLPRSVIEAMSRGVPVVSSNLPGLKGIVDEQFQFRLNQSGSLKKIVSEVLSSREILSKMSVSSIRVASGFHIDFTRLKRKQFYSNCKNLIQ